MTTDKSKYLEDIKVACKSMYSEMENICWQAKKEIEILDNTNFNASVANSYFKKSLLFIEYINSISISHKYALEDAQSKLSTENNEGKKFNRSRLSLKGLLNTSETQDVSSDPEIKRNLTGALNELYYYDKFDLKPCSVVLKNSDDKLGISETKTFYDKELREIERLTNLESLKKSARHRSPSNSSNDEGINKNAKRPRIAQKKLLSSDTDSNITDISVSVLQDILNYSFRDTEDSTEDSTTSEETDTDCELLFNAEDEAKRTTENEKAEKTLDNKKPNVRNHEPSAIDPKIQERKKWRGDKLLTGKLKESSSSDDEDPKKEKKNTTTTNVEGNEKDKERKNLEFVEVPNFDKTSIIALSSDSENSDVEFVKVLSSRQNRNTSDNENENKKGRRKNIRAVKTDEALEEATKIAARKEEERTQRLLQKEQNLLNCSTERQFGLVLDADEETNEPLISVNFELTEKLKRHQQDGVRFMWNICYESVKRLTNSEGTGCILAHCMGLGKTFQVIALIHTLFTHPVTNTKRVLVVCPLSTVLNWKHEFEIGLSAVSDGVPKTFYISSRNSDKDGRVKVVIKWLQELGVLVMGYEAYQTLIKLVPPGLKLSEKQKRIKEALIDPGPDLVICDEGHLLKNGNNNRTKSLMKIRTKRRIILTGTPLQINLIEYYYMVQFVKSNLLGTFASLIQSQMDNMKIRRLKTFY